MDKSTPHRSFLDLSYWIILILFFLSGACGLIYEILWSRYLTLFLGSTTTAYTIVLAVFMGGLGLGNFLIGRLSDRQKNNLALFAWLQMLIGIYGVIFPLFWRSLSHTYISIAPALEGSPFVLNLLKLIFSMASIFPPALLMGGTLPVLVRHLTRDIRQVRHNVSVLYYINSFGAVAGCLVVGLFLIRAFGITASNYLAAGISMGIGMAALFLSFLHGRVSVVEESPGMMSQEESGGERIGHGVKVAIVLTAMALSGFTAMTYELAWTRLLSIILGSTTYSFPIMLAAFISGISLGSLIIARRKDLKTDPYLLFGLCELGIFISILLSIPIYQWLPFAFLELNLLLGRTTGSFVIFQGLKFGFSFLVMLVPTIFFGMTLPLVSHVYAREVAQVGQDVGTVFAFDTAGGVVGALTAGLLLIPGIGLRHTIEVAFLINMAIGIVIISFPLNEKGLFRKAFIGVLSLLVVFYFAFLPEWDQHMMNAGAGRFTRREPLTFKEYLEDSRKGEVLFFKEGRSTTVSVERKLGVKTLLINSKPEASTMGDMPTQIMIGHLPLILSTDTQDVLVVGIGSGITIGSVLTHPVRHVDCVEISEAVFDASKYFSPENRDYWKDERIHVNIEDAKHFVKSTDRLYDVIISEPSNPWVAGVADLFTVEFFNHCKRKLKPHGVMAQWFHGYSMDMENFRLIVRTFARCFDQVTMWEAMEDDYILIGVAEDYAPDFDLMKERIAREAVKKDMSLINIGDLATLLSRQFVSGDYVHRIVGDGVVNRELRPVLEYNAPLVLFKRKRVSIVQIDERFNYELTDLYINRYRRIYALTAANYHHMAAYEFKNPFDSDLRLAYALMDRCTSMAPGNEEFLYNFAILLQKMGKLDYAREITARLLRIDKENRDYQEMFVEITFAIEQEKGSIFYLPIKDN